MQYIKMYMKRLSLIILSLSLSVVLFAQKPGSNLHKTLAQIQQQFPNLQYGREKNGYLLYKSPGEGSDITWFYFSSGRVVGEYTYIFDYSDSGYITDLYKSLLNSFSKYGGKHWRTTSSSYDITYFRYSYFTIKVANYGDQLQLYYELNDLNIEISPLVVRHLR